MAFQKGYKNGVKKALSKSVFLCYSISGQKGSLSEQLQLIRANGEMSERVIKDKEFAMFKINWKNLVLLEGDQKFLSIVAGRLTHINEAGKSLVRRLISDADWEGRIDLIRAFQPNEEYKNGEEILFNDGKIGKIQKVENGYNPVHGSFQIICVSFGSNTVGFACAVDGATPLEYKEYKSLDDDELQEEVDEIFDKHGDGIRQTILKGIESGSLDIVRFESQLLSKSSLKRIGEEKLLNVKEHLKGEIVPKSAEELLEYAFEDEASDEEKELRIF
ncbi:TPA: hypothetical protein EYP66_13570, partial [Candidatus Poribacteria bacterium]|nr:hypothetical protein [Candidatus Poribacteria bacterium]